MERQVTNEYFHLQGYEITRKLILQGVPEEIPDMLHELGDILAELSIEKGDRVSNLQIQQIMNAEQVKISATLISQPKGQ